VRILAVLVAACAACSGSPAAPDAGPPDATPLPLTGSINSYAGGSTIGAGIAGAQICAGHPDPLDCATTASDGTYALAVTFLPGNVDAVFTATATGYLGMTDAWHDVTSAPQGPGQLALFTDAYATSYLGTEAGFTYPDTTHGFVRVFVGIGNTSTAFEGAAVRIAAGAAQGPVYTQNGFVPTPGLTATTSDGLVLFGGVAPGRFTVIVTAATGHTCAPVAVYGWPSSTASAVDGFAVAGAISNVRLECT
jgi:hypothetical protein